MASAESNPLLTRSALPFELPAFSKISTDDFRAAFAVGMAEQLAEVAHIADNPEPADFVNTVEALERSGRVLNRATTVFFNLVSSTATEAIQQLEAEISPQLTAHQDAISLNPQLFQRIRAVYDQRADLGLDAESIRLVERYHLDFVRAGADSTSEATTALRALNQRISVLGTTFGQNLLAASRAAAVLVESADELDGLDADAVAAAAERATEAGHRGKYLVTLVLPSGQPVLSRLRNRALRERVHVASLSRGSSAPHDNGPVAIEIAMLRAQRAELLGYASHADYVTADTTAGTSQAVDQLLAQLVPAALRNARREADRLAELAAADGLKLAAWDWTFYSDQVRSRSYAVDSAALRPYFELNRVLQDGVFYAANQLYGITFEAREDLVGYHPDVRVFEVRDADRTSLGLFLGDFFARPDKRGGAWMNTFVDQNRLLDQHPVVVNNLNVNKPAPGEPALLTVDETRTLFHEFGHALHGLFSSVRYPRFSGTRVPGDFVEFPSQLNEMWQWWPEVVQHYAFHHATGAALGADVIEKIRQAELWGEGFATVEYLAATLLDQAWHRLGPHEKPADATAFEREALAAAGIADELIPPRYRTCYFQHIFSGGYAAGYYFYIWAEVLDAASVEWFRANGGLTRANGTAFRAKLLSVGGSSDAMQTVRDVLGADPEVGPLLRRRGLDG